MYVKNTKSKIRCNKFNIAIVQSKSDIKNKANYRTIKSTC